MENETLKVFLYIFGSLLCILALIFGIPMLFNLHSNAALLLIVAILAMIAAFIGTVGYDLIGKE